MVSEGLCCQRGDEAGARSELIERGAGSGSVVLEDPLELAQYEGSALVPQQREARPRSMKLA